MIDHVTAFESTHVQLEVTAWWIIKFLQYNTLQFKSLGLSFLKKFLMLINAVSICNFIAISNKSFQFLCI